jgi:hypothetical protein
MNARVRRLVAVSALAASLAAAGSCAALQRFGPIRGPHAARVARRHRSATARQSDVALSRVRFP